MSSALPLTIGMDEVGRGALAGPVVVGALSLAGADPEEVADRILEETGLPYLADSKQLTPLRRERLFNWIETKLIWAVGEATSGEIDRLGLQAALTLAAKRALLALQRPGYFLDRIVADAGLKHPFNEIPTLNFIKGDQLIFEIALASVMAKVWRDRKMVGVAKKYPGYGLEKNVGYGSRQHRESLLKQGSTPLHRKSFLGFIQRAQSRADLVSEGLLI